MKLTDRHRGWRRGRVATHDYGFQQWVTTSDGHEAFAALGAAGQMVEVVPDLDLVVVVQSTAPNDLLQGTEPGTADAPEYLALVNRLIAPAID